MFGRTLHSLGTLAERPPRLHTALLADAALRVWMALLASKLLRTPFSCDRDEPVTGIPFFSLITVVTAGLADGGSYPLAAVFADRNGRLAVVQTDGGVHSLPVASGFSFVEGDLNRDGARVVAAARRADDISQTQLLSFDRRKPERGWQPIALLEGDEVGPRFSPDGKTLFVSGRSSVGPGGPENPTQFYRLVLEGERYRHQRLSDGSACYFGAAPTSTNSFVAVKTNCYFSPHIISREPNRDGGMGERRVEAARPDDELAVSPDGLTVAHFQRVQDSIRVSILRGAEQPRELVTIPIEGAGPFHPRFACPRDVLFVVGGKVNILNTDTGKFGAVTVLQ
jgi:hypothetical protein